MSLVGKKTVILGASTNPDRYAYLAAERLELSNHNFIPVGIKNGDVLGKEILDLRQKPFIEDVDTITIYLNPKNQEMWEDYMLSLQPKRIVFNPGTENPMLMERASDLGIEVLAACTLTMLSVGLY